MKKIAIVLGVLVFAAPALAEVAITATDEGSCTASIAYTSDANVSAFALEITVTGANIIDISDYHVGDCNAAERGYGIFPANFNRYIDANNPNWNDANYTPVADPCDPGAAGTGLGTDKIIIEMGALYEDGNQPSLSGTLCKVEVDGDCNLSVVANAMRGKVVLTDFSEVDPNVAGATDVPIICGEPDCFPACHPDYTLWVNLGKPDSWCYPRQCRGDADGQTEEIGKGTFWVGYNDLNIFIANFKDKAGVTAALPADFDHATEEIGKGTFRVGYNDLGIFIANFKDKLGSPPDCLDCP
jgi:hypothetical protein